MALVVSLVVPLQCLCRVRLCCLSGWIKGVTLSMRMGTFIKMTILSSGETMISMTVRLTKAMTVLVKCSSILTVDLTCLILPVSIVIILFAVTLWCNPFFRTETRWVMSRRICVVSMT